MKNSGLLIVIAIVVIGYCMYNSLVVNPAEVGAEVVKQSSGDCKGPFGFDSQKISPETLDYQIGIVSDIDLEKNPDGTWYVASCIISNTSAGVGGTVLFAKPYPQQNDLKVGDFIGYTATLDRNRIRGPIFTYVSGKIFENISKQSAKCKIDDLPHLSKPYTQELTTCIHSARQVTGVVMALKIVRNPDPEPDHPSDYLISRAVMKCEDGNLYIVLFGTDIDSPDHGAFVEGDVITVIQTIPMDDDDDLIFLANWE